MTNTNLKINLNILEVAVNEYFQAKEESKLFLKTWVGGWWEFKTAKQREDYTKYDKRTVSTLNTIWALCSLLDIDSKVLISTIKAFNRYTRHNGKWDRYISISRMLYWQEENFLSSILNNSEKYYYKSTGRKNQTLS